MAIKDVDTKCFILALFIRSDGARFLLGSGAYEFKDSQQHFAANTMENDVVEVQGNDGYLLAGQVRRPGVQSFDGYVGDAGTDKAQVERRRREFFSFFRKNFTYKVIYVFPDGSAIQRKRGFIVDAPVVQELYQIYPEYHVALNFEDINYYQYNEDADGNEIYGKSAVLGLTVAASGGLVWDGVGAVSVPYTWAEPVEFSGSEVTVMNNLNVGAPIEEVQLKGDTEQVTYEGKNLLDYNTYTGKSATGDVSLGSGVVRMTQTTTNPGGNCYVYFDVNRPDLAGQQVVFSTKATSGGGSTGTRARFTKITSSTEIARSLAPTSSGSSRTFTVPSDGEIRIYFYANASNVTGVVGAYSEYTEVQLELGSTATDFEPYVGGIPSPNPDYPQEVQTVTGEQVVTISDGDNQSQSYTISLGSTELCKIGDYQDYIYKNGDEWYVHKEVKIVTLDGTSGYWGYVSNLANVTRFGVNSADIFGGIQPTSTSFTNMFSDYFIGGNAYNSSNDTPCASLHGGNVFYMKVPNSIGTTLGNISQSGTLLYWLNQTRPSFYFQLTTPTETQITDTTLIGQLEALEAMKLFAGENNLLVAASGTNLPATLEGRYYGGIDYSGAGYVWEAGGDGGAKVLTIDSIDDVYPLLTITGPAVNPTITNITAGVTFTYAGTVTNSQVLKVDMMNKTATLNGTSVIGNVSGDWLYFVPGDNRVEYTTDNAGAPDALIEWQEVVG